jgi:hypothetical protein
MEWTKEQIRRVVTEGRRFESQAINRRLANKAVVKGIRRLDQWQRRGRDGVGFSGKGVKGSRLAFIASLNSKLWGKPLAEARAYCVRHAGQLANFANTGKPRS